MDVQRGDSRPIPDPTVLTDQLVNKAIASLTTEFNAKMAALADKQDLYNETTTRHTDIAAATLRDLLTTKISGAEQVLAQKIDFVIEAMSVFKTTVNERFALGDVQTDKAARDVKSAVDAAFAAAKEAVGEQNKSNALSIAKSEVATTKQIDQLSQNLTISVKNTDDKIDSIKKNFDDKYTDIKDRIVAMEARGSVSDPSTSGALSRLADRVESLRLTDARGTGEKHGVDASNVWIIGIIGLLATVAMAVFAGLEFSLRAH